MWIADHWKDYEVLDTSSGEKLERWGDYRLVRPDPQVIWNTPHGHEGWKKKNGHYHRSAKGGGEWEFFHLPEEWTIHYANRNFVKANPASTGEGGELTFHLKPFSFKHTGLFPEQAANWDWFSAVIRQAKEKEPDREVRILNLFAYTGGATLAAAAAGASVTHVDAAKGMVAWAKENAASSGLSDAPIRYLVDDCVKFVEREIRRGNQYDGIIMDPPSYGRGPKGEIWKIEESVFPFIELAVKLLKKDALFFLINSYTTGLQPAVLSYMLGTALVKPFGGKVESAEIGLPVTESGLILPCGASGRWMRTE
ncbi:MAG: class I SAM-dependent methyltransferase [Lachnospiraceae bacterium]|nr:class I SAM-dependent methyltransferase [Lachnospiraceae bacterium]